VFLVLRGGARRKKAPPLRCCFVFPFLSILAWEGKEVDWYIANRGGIIIANRGSIIISNSGRIIIVIFSSAGFMSIPTNAHTGNGVLWWYTLLIDWFPPCTSLHCADRLSVKFSPTHFHQKWCSRLLLFLWTHFFLSYMFVNYKIWIKMVCGMVVLKSAHSMECT